MRRKIIKGKDMGEKRDKGKAQTEMLTRKLSELVEPTYYPRRYRVVS